MGAALPMERRPTRQVNLEFRPSKSVKDLTPEEKANPITLFEAKGHDMRENEVAIQSINILREHILRCARREGVNAQQNCRHLALRYVHAIMGPGMILEGPSAHMPEHLRPLPPLDDYEITHEMASNNPVWNQVNKEAAAAAAAAASASASTSPSASAAAKTPAKHH